MAVSTQPTRVRRVLIALALAGVFIFGAYLLSNPNLFAPSTANAESTQALLAAYAQKKGPDGLPLWEDQLIATASSTAWSTAASTTDEDTTPAPGITPASGSLTDQFAQNLFTQYMSQEAGNDPSDDDVDIFAQETIQTLVQDNTQQDPYAESAVKVADGTGSDALVTYAAAVDQAIDANNTVSTGENELDYFSDAVEKNDLSALPKLATIGNTYISLASALMQVEVPSYAVTAHLEIANELAKVGQDIVDMSTMETDPLRAYLGLSQYETDGPALVQAFSDMYMVYQAQGVVVTPDEQGYSFYSILETAAPQTTGTT